MRHVEHVKIVQNAMLLSQVDKLTVLDTHKMLKAGHGSMRHSGTASFLRHSMFQINPSELLPDQPSATTPTYTGLTKQFSTVSIPCHLMYWAS